MNNIEVNLKYIRFFFKSKVERKRSMERKNRWKDRKVMKGQQRGEDEKKFEWNGNGGLFVVRCVYIILVKII